MSEPTQERIKLAERRVYNVGSGVNPHMIAMEGQVLANAFSAVEAENKRLQEALAQYANKRNWNRDKHGRLNIFDADTNGPFIAFAALYDGDKNE